MDKMQQQRSEIETESMSLHREMNNSRTNLLHRFNRNVVMNNGLDNNDSIKRRDNLSNRSPNTDESTEVEYDEDLGDDDVAPNNIPRKNPVCGLCHLPSAAAGVAGISSGPGPMFSCAHGHLLCQQCVQRYTVCSEIGCAVCGADIYTSTSASNCCRVTNRLSSGNPNVESACGDPRSETQGILACAGTMRSLARGQEFERPRSWSHRDCNEAVDSNGAAFFGGNNRCIAAAFDPGWDGNADGDYSSGIRTTVRMPNANSIRTQHEQQQIRNRSCAVARGGDVDLESESLQKNGNAALAHAECSRRPIRCPRLDCAVNVAFSALTHHFLFDHPEVPILSVEPGNKSTLVVSFAALSCDSSRCLALLLVSGKLTGIAARLFNGTQIQPRYRNRLPLPVLAARLHCSSQNFREDEDRARGEGQSQGDVVIAWVAGLDVGNGTSSKLRCSIQAIDANDNGALRSLTYTGPVNSLRTAQRPRDVLKTGDCVILHQGLIDHISSGCSSLNVNVIVH